MHFGNVPRLSRSHEVDVPSSAIGYIYTKKSDKIPFNLVS